LFGNGSHKNLTAKAFYEKWTLKMRFLTILA